MNEQQRRAAADFLAERLRLRAPGRAHYQWWKHEADIAVQALIEHGWGPSIKYEDEATEGFCVCEQPTIYALDCGISWHREKAREARLSSGPKSAHTLTSGFASEPDEPCCTYRDHGANLGCACPDEKHVGDLEHPFAQNLPWQEDVRRD